ncbi:MAG: protease SohB [Gammaproteobacteria bacterium]
MDFITDYGLFVAKLATVLVFLLALTFGLVLIRKRGRAGQEERLEVKRLNDKYDAMALALRAAMGPRRAFRKAHKAFKAERKARAKDIGGDGSGARKRVFVLRFQGDIRASAVAALREEVSAVLAVATPNDEVVVILESPGGVVHGYGLAASQLQRFKDHGISLTVAVDKVAASGGYLMACVAQRIIAAPFAILGSIGVVGQMPNFNRLLKSHDVDYELITAGEHKRTLTLFGENTEKGREKFREDIEITHALFKDFVRSHRPDVDIEKVSTGEHWYGLQALDLKLVDAVRTSDDYLRDASAAADLYELTYIRKRRGLERFLSPGVWWG